MKGGIWKSTKRKGRMLQDETHQPMFDLEIAEGAKYTL
jgi:hypothetical protein